MIRHAVIPQESSRTALPLPLHRRSVSLPTFRRLMSAVLTLMASITVMMFGDHQSGLGDLQWGGERLAASAGRHPVGTRCGRRWDHHGDRERSPAVGGHRAKYRAPE